MKITKQARRDGKVLFNACRVEGVLDENRVRQAVTLVIERKPRGFLSTLSHFQRLVKLDLDRRSATVINSSQTTPDQMTAIRQHLSQRYGAGLNVTFWVDPKLIGGIKIKVGSDIFDGSVAGRLAQLEADL
jgi:F-type H+-transporting ATPase subunit delta